MGERHRDEDRDGEGLPDVGEQSVSLTDPAETFSDTDGLPHGEEVFSTSTDPAEQHSLTATRAG